jgi:protein-tyrosine phosphatase
MKTILFLCSGNYYRSRFAEEYFNHLAATHGHDWRAVSRGLAADRPNGNVGAISPLALAALREHGVMPAKAPRMPQQVTPDEFTAAALVIALKEAEHRPMVTTRFPEYADRVEYWTVHDLDVASAEQVLPELAVAVDQLYARLTHAG